jgi:hypothetical protein
VTACPFATPICCCFINRHHIFTHYVDHDLSSYLIHLTKKAFYWTVVDPL